MLANIADAARSGLQYGASGLIVCDWGDGGHWQIASISYPAYAYAAGAAWQAELNLQNLDPLKHYVSQYMLQDRSGKGGAWLLELGRYELLERSTAENMTYTNFLLSKGLMPQAQLEQTLAFTVQVQKILGGTGTPMEYDYRYEELAEWLTLRKEELASLELEGEDAELLYRELFNTLRLIEQGGGLHRYIHRQNLSSELEAQEWLSKLHDGLETAVQEFQSLWLARNRSGGLQESVVPFNRLLEQYKEKLTNA